MELNLGVHESKISKTTQLLGNLIPPSPNPQESNRADFFFSATCTQDACPSSTTRFHAHRKRSSIRYSLDCTHKPVTLNPSTYMERHPNGWIKYFPNMIEQLTKRSQFPSPSPSCHPELSQALTCHTPFGRYSLILMKHGDYYYITGFIITAFTSPAWSFLSSLTLFRAPSELAKPLP